jgi:NIMA (never in mitosis gene a)-related kinase
MAALSSMLLIRESQIIEWFIQLCLALKHVHKRGILHRDIKSQNIFITATNDLKLGDFGIARVLLRADDKVVTAIGTPYYLSPEICQEKPYDQKSDVWGLGCILYEMMELRRPFEASSLKGLVLKIINGVLPEFTRAFSKELIQILMEMLSKDPVKRPSIVNILEKPFIKSKIGAVLSQTIRKFDEYKAAKQPQTIS